MSDISNQTPMGIPSNLQSASSALQELMHDHVELFGIELQEQKQRTVKAVVLTGMALGLAWLLLLGLSTLVLIVFWDSYRLSAIIGLCLLQAVAMLICIWRAKAQHADQPHPFSASLAELARDRERLLP